MNSQPQKSLSISVRSFLTSILVILALMTVIGAFLISGVGRFYIGRFYDSMEKTFSQEFIQSLQQAAENGDDPARQLTEMLMAQTDLGIDITSRNVYVLDAYGTVLDASVRNASVAVTENLLTAMAGQVGQTSPYTADFMDLAVPVQTESTMYIVYILDNKATVNDLTQEVLSVVLRSLVLGVAICIVLSILLSRILITPIRALTTGTQQVAAGDFSQKLSARRENEFWIAE